MLPGTRPGASKKEVEKPSLFITGPTSAGKSALALDLARTFSGVVINADALQVYRGLELLTAQPPARERSIVPHELYGFLSPHQVCSAGFWRLCVLRAIARARRRGLWPILVGGSGLYLQTLVQGLSHIPSVPKRIRQQGRAQLERQGKEEFFAQLCRLDKTLLHKPVPDTHRLLRHWEVLQASGRTLSFWHRHYPPSDGISMPILVVQPPRVGLYRRAETRFSTMLQSGALEEVRALGTQNVPSDAPALKAHGVVHLSRYLRGELTLKEAIVFSQRDTRRYIKRQETWLRRAEKNFRTRPFLVVRDTEGIANRVMEVLDTWTDNVSCKSRARLSSRDSL